jgi:hypothetical protein
MHILEYLSLENQFLRVGQELLGSCRQDVLNGDRGLDVGILNATENSILREDHLDDFLNYGHPEREEFKSQMEKL